jgi:hypothetical protein
MVQIIKHKCCNSVYAACSEPHCYEDKDWQKTLRQASKEGDVIEMVESGSKFQFKICECNHP